MSDQATLPNPSGAKSALWVGWLGAPGWWLAQFEARYAFVPWCCTHGHRWWVFGLGGVALVGSIAIAAWAWRRQHRSTGDQPRTFLVVGSAWCATFFALLVLAQMLPDLFLDPCRK